MTEVAVFATCNKTRGSPRVRIRFATSAAGPGGLGCGGEEGSALKHEMELKILIDCGGIGLGSTVRYCMKI
jgi:hypothetical protein